MKFLPPIIALLVVSAWLGARHHAITSVGEQVTILEQRIETARSGNTAPATDGSLASRVRHQRDAFLNSSGSLDWKRVAGRLASSGHDMRTFAGVQQRIIEMSASELIDALDEIDRLELPKDIRDQLESMLAGQLARKDPQQALERFGDRIGTKQGGIAWQLTEAIARWADDDPAAAGAWFDRRIKAGAFDTKSLSGHNRERTRFEAAIIGSLLGSDPAAAGKRLAAVPESQRAEILRQHWILKLQPSEHRAFAALTRQHAADGGAPAVFAHTASSIGRGSDGYQRVSDFIDRIDATPDELQAIVSQTAEDRLTVATRSGPIGRAAVDEMHTWLATESPAKADALTGHTLGTLIDSTGNPETIVAIATDLHEETGSDDLLVSFLTNGKLQNHPDLARPLIEKISDPVQRELLHTQFPQPAISPDAPELPTPQ